MKMKNTKKNLLERLEKSEISNNDLLKIISDRDEKISELIKDSDKCKKLNKAFEVLLTCTNQDMLVSALARAYDKEKKEYDNRPNIFNGLGEILGSIGK